MVLTWARQIADEREGRGHETFLQPSPTELRRILRATPTASSGSGPSSVSPLRGAETRYARCQRSRADVGCDRVVPGIERRPQRGKSCDGDDGDESGDQSILDCRRAALILEQSPDQCAHQPILHERWRTWISRLSIKV